MTYKCDWAAQFDSKPDDRHESDSDDVDESLTVPVPGVDVCVITHDHSLA